MATRKFKSDRAILVPAERIERKIYLIRGQKVMLSSDLAQLYGVSQKRLNEAVKRNIGRFPNDFMFRLTKEEAKVSRSQFATLKRGQNLKYLPFAFTEQGVAMLSAVLRSATAIAVSIQIMRVFVQLRQLLASNEQFRRKFEELETRLSDHDEKFAVVFEALRELMDDREEDDRKPKIGFETERTSK
jgi:hypothetical protein